MPVAHSFDSAPSFARLTRPSLTTTLRLTAHLTPSSRLSRVTWTSPPAWSRTWPARAPSTATPSAATRPQQTLQSWHAAKPWPSWRGATPTSCSWWCTTAARGAAATPASHRCVCGARHVDGVGKVRQPHPRVVATTDMLPAHSSHSSATPATASPSPRWTRSMQSRTCCWVLACRG